MKKFIFLLLAVIACGSSSEETGVQDTKSITSTSSTITTIISDNTSTDDKNKVKNKFENINSKFIFDTDSFPSYEWSQSFELIELDKSCINNSTFNQNSNFSTDAKINFEKIFLKSFDEIIRDDIFNIQKITIDETFISYEGLEYLTCLQYLDAGQGFNFWGRDYRFLSNLTELRYLNCNFCGQLRAEHLYPLKKLEYLITPAGFKNTSMLYKLSNLKYIDSQKSEGSCNDYDLLDNLENLKELYLGNSDLSFYLNNNYENSNDDFVISKSPSGKYIELLIKDGYDSFFTDFSDPDWTSNPTGFYSRNYMAKLMNTLYKEIDDEYEVIIFVANRLDSIRSYNGMALNISNNEPGLSLPIYSSADCYGSSGKLRGNLIFPSLNSFFNSTTTTYDWGDFTFVNAPLMHELLHLWGGADILPYHQVFVDKPGAGGGHFGFSTGGILGGFNNESLKELGNNNYQVDYFIKDGNYSDTKMGNIEKYIMGLLPSSELGDLYAFIGDPILVDEYCEKTLGKEDVFSICFNANKKITYTVEDLEQLYGKVDFKNKRNVSTLVVFVTDEKPSEEAWSTLDQKVSWYIENITNDDGGYNIFEASDGLLELKFPIP
tara:strand:+ start:105 stop:1919 length:1815 start_codon:yes stop_codon:yes gene_type:complete